jgi:hypothetical protein
VDLAPFACTNTPCSSLIQRVCYDKAQAYMLISLQRTYYHSCEVARADFDAFMAAPSMGQHYNKHITVSASDGPYDCRKHQVLRTSQR